MNSEDQQDQADEQVFDSLRAAFASVRLSTPLESVRADADVTRIDGQIGSRRLPRRGFLVAAAAVAGVAVAGGITWSLHRPTATQAGIGVDGRIATDGDASSLALSPSGHLLAFWDSDRIQLWDVSDRTHPIQTALLPAVTVFDMSFSLDGTTLVVTTMSATGPAVVQLWHVADPIRPRKLGEVPLTGQVGHVRLSANGRLLCTSTTVATVVPVTSDTTTIQLWDVSNPAGPAKLGSLPGPPRPPQGGSFAVSRDGRTLATTLDQQADGTVVAFWDISDPAHPRQERTMTAPVDLSKPILLDMNPPLFLAPSDNGTTLWSLSGEGKAVGINNLVVAETPEPILPVLAAYGTTLALVHGDAPLGANPVRFDQVDLWDIANPVHPRFFGTVPITPGGNGECALAAASRVLAVSTGDHIALSRY